VIERTASVAPGAPAAPAPAAARPGSPSPPAPRAARARGRTGALTSGWGNPWGYAFVAPALALYVIFNAYPVLRGLAMAFTDYRFLVPGSEWSFNGLNNYRELFFNDRTFWHAFGVSLRYTLLTFPTSLLLALGVALLVAQVRTVRLAAFYRVIVYLPVVLPISVAMLLWQQLYHYQLGYLNFFLKSVFHVASPPNWLGDVNVALPAIAIATVWKSFGADTLLFLIGLYGINREIYEAAAIDGANPLQQAWYVTLPLLKPVFVLVVALNAGIASATQEMLILTNGGPQNATLTLGLYGYQLGFQNGDLRLGYSAAMYLLLGVIHMVLAFVILKTLRTERA
jgi:multiple sugar transport system permease protein